MARYYRIKMHGMETRLAGVLCPGSETDAPLPASGLAEVSGIEFRDAIFDTFGGCSEGTVDLLMSCVKRVADRQGTSKARLW